MKIITETQLIVLINLAKTQRFDKKMDSYPNKLSSHKKFVAPKKISCSRPRFLGHIGKSGPAFKPSGLCINSQNI